MKTAASVRSRLIRRLATAGAISAAAVVLAGGLLGSTRASADGEWCWNDPVVAINGIQLQTLIGVHATQSQLQHVGLNTATITYTVPAGVSTNVVSVSAPYLKEKVRFTHSDTAWAPGQPIPITVSVSFNGDSRFAAEMVNNEHGAQVSDVHGNTDDGLVAGVIVR